MTRRLHALLALFLVVGLSARADAGRPAKGPAKNPKLGEYARARGRNKGVTGRKNGTFARVGAPNRLARTRLTASGRANPSSVGQSSATVAFRPSRGARPGSLTVEIPEFYVGSSMGGTSTERQLFATDIRGKSVPITGKLVVGANSPGNSFVKARFVGTIPGGTRLSQRGIERALKGLHVNELSLTWSKPAAR